MFFISYSVLVVVVVTIFLNDPLDTQKVQRMREGENGRARVLYSIYIKCSFISCHTYMQWCYVHNMTRGIEGLILLFFFV